MKTPNKRIALIILSLVIVITLFFAGRFIPTLAKAIYPDMYGLVEKNEPKLINDLSTQEEVKTESTDESFPSINDEVITPVTPDAKSQLSTMLSELGNITFSKSGWIHFVYSNESDISNGVILPDGNLMPQNYINDGWYFVNDQGFVIKHLISLVDDAGNVLQREIFVNDTLVNLTTNEKMENIQPYRLKLDLGFSQEMLAMQDGGAILGEETDEIEGKPVIKFSIQGTFDKPTVLSNGSQPVKSIKLLMIFDQQNGAINEAEKIWQLTDDTEVLFEKNQVLTLQSDELPNEIAQILECGKMKKMILPSIVISLLLLILTATLVSATAGTWTYRLYALNISGTSDGYSGKMVNYLANGTTWGANILTYIDNPPIKLAIGWNYFSGTEKCGTITMQNVQGGSRYINAQQTANTIYLTKIGCGGIRYGLSNGKHIVSSPGGTNYYDEWTLTEQIP